MARQGAFAGDDRARLGFLHWLMFRLCRSLIDTGIHDTRRQRFRSVLHYCLSPDSFAMTPVAAPRAAGPCNRLES